MAGPKRMDVSFTARATAVGRMRNEIAVDWPAMGQSWTFATDEAPALGGEDTAPPPLALIVAGLAGCLMTNIRMFARKMGVDLRGLSVDVRADWVRIQTGTAPHVADTAGFALDVTMDSAQDTDAQRALLDAAKAGCFVEHALVNAVPVRHRLKTPQGWIDA